MVEDSFVFPIHTIGALYFPQEWKEFAVICV
jgi:hypothetical protein